MKERHAKLVFKNYILSIVLWNDLPKMYHVARKEKLLTECNDIRLHIIFGRLQIVLQYNPTYTNILKIVKKLRHNRLGNYGII